MATATRYLTVRELEQAVEGTDPSVLFVSPHALNRIVRVDRRLSTFGLSIPHRQSYFIARERLIEFVSRFELAIDIDRRLPDSLILLERPDEDEIQDKSPGRLLYDYWRQLFHVRVHLALEQQIENETLTDNAVLDRLRRLGGTQYAEIRAVLQREEMLLPPRTDRQIYIEFAAVFLELWYFAPSRLQWYFSTITDVDSVVAMLAEDLDHTKLYESTRVPGAADYDQLGREDQHTRGSILSPLEMVNVDPLKPSPPAYWRLLARAEKLGSLGNVVKAAILRHKAAQQALPDRARDAELLAHAELERLARRLRPVLGLTDDETHDWAAALIPLLDHADRGLRSRESRLLYDLQKVCLERERGVYALDVVRWVRSKGRVPIRRPLPLLREVLVTKHLQRAARKLTASRLTGAARSRLAALIQSAVQRAKRKLRDRVRPRIVAALESEGLHAHNVPERVAFRKIVEELLDRIVERGYLSLGHVRDTLSQNNLKLSDLTSLWELLSGDLLLRIDRRLAETLDGIYHRGPIYLRMSQRLSAMAFGTSFGRALTQWVALPYGGALLILAFLLHLYDLLQKTISVQTVEQLTTTVPGVVHSAATHQRLWDPRFGAVAFVLGTFFWFLIHRPAFRSWCLQGLKRIAQLLRLLVYDLPTSLLRLPWVKRLWESPLYGVFVNYAFKPAVFTVCLLFPIERRFGSLTWGAEAITFLAVNLLLNSPLGRYSYVVVTELLLRSWRELQIRVFAAAFRMVVDLFQWVLHTMEQVLYTVDEWLRFRAGEQKWVLALKVLLATVWSVIAYVIRIYITLLVEPQVNPIKHFPVVTVSHKFMFTFSIHLTTIMAAPLKPLLGPFWANAIAGSTVFLLPGVFGFLVWELKENWRLYASNRPKTLRPIHIGGHGETMTRLLRQGFHSGTVPNLFEKLRRSARRAFETGNSQPIHKFHEKLNNVEECVKRYVERELISLLKERPEWRDLPLEVVSVTAASNQFTVELGVRDPKEEPLRIVFQERANWLVASLTHRGWLNAIESSQQESFLRAITGLYKTAGVDLVWEELITGLGGKWHWCDFHNDGLIVWQDENYNAATLIKLRDTGVTTTPTVSPQLVTEPTAEELDRLVFARTPLTWQLWLETWQTDEDASPNFLTMETPGVSRE